MRRTALFQHPDFVHHETGSDHPECLERYRAIIDALENSPLQQQLQWWRPDPVELRWVEENHDTAYIRHIEEACLSGSSQLDKGETRVSHDSFQVALLAAGAATGAVDAVMAGACENAFCAIRPPGHHAERARPMGFCLFNNVAIAAHYARKQHGLERVFILDWDVHHGNGTQHSFYDDGQVFFCSLHQYPFYPGTGEAAEQGIGAGKGATLNLPLPPRTSGRDFLNLINGPVADAVTAFRPEMILVSAGFDAHHLDPIANLELTEEDFGAMTRTVCQLAEEQCGGRIVSVLEGGYHLDALAASVQEHLRALLGEG
ncbi:histone deacetylase [Ruficoccus sp. ZRK36]|uniref:histone deacetylase family protein n=1 Tax=Ruficoccus sp. ZRK36 TaxID=2866311 RepID=UPI001C72C2F4|nr:histone deacetylase [Ruficoccus sp. ZRK36]QYY35895.1 histone deacetylase [Ruficoccus sp. ZRK36]